MTIQLTSKGKYTADQVWEIIEDLIDSANLNDIHGNGRDAGPTLLDYAVNQYGIDA